MIYKRNVNDKLDRKVCSKVINVYLIRCDYKYLK